MDTGADKGDERALNDSAGAPDSLACIGWAAALALAAALAIWFSR